MTSRKINELVVHASATPPSMDIGAEWIDRVHRKRGFLKIGYHFVIRRDGTEEVGRPIEQPGAHVRGHNYDSIGICMIGGVDADMVAEDNFTLSQYATLRDLLESIRVYYPEADISGHRDFSPDLDGNGKITSNEWFKMCPCFDVRGWCRSGGLDPIGNRTGVDATTLQHRVLPGDSLYSISRAYGVTVRELRDANPEIEDPDLIQPGYLLSIP